MSKYFEVTSNPQYSQFIALSRYARWLEDENRRETWEETVDRYIKFFKVKFTGKTISTEAWDEIRNAILHLEVLPSMRALMTAGKALEKSNIAGYNCSYIAIDNPRAFDETLFVLLNGTGLGFSVERQYVSRLPDVAEEFYPTDTVIKVSDSKLGWAKAYRELISLLYVGQIPKWDVSLIRPAGAKLRTFGGRAAGSDGLVDLFQYTIEIFMRAKGRKLSSLECHDILCKIGEVVVIGGTRRSALISLSNLSDDRMRDAKKGQFWLDEAQRSLANNSACYTEKPEFTQFMKEWFALHESRCGERGIFNRVAAKKQVRQTGRRDADYDFGVNPCGEILLRPNQLCNLSTIVVRATDTLETLKRKVRLATILGTMQSSLTDFPYVRSAWKNNCEDERLLGVSMTGIMDNDMLAGRLDTEELKQWLDELKVHAIDTNKQWAEVLDINPSTAVTAIKPEGTTSQLTDSGSGIHDRFAQYYIRRVRSDKKDPLAQFMKDMGFHCEDDIVNPSGVVFSFPIKAPVDIANLKKRTAVEQLEHWKIFKEHWCDHNVSCTIYYTDDEFLEVGNWVWKNFDGISGVSFLPHTNHVYQQAPYEEITVDKYEKLLTLMPKDVDWSRLSEYEKDDTTTSSQTLACVGNVCEMVDLSTT